MFPKFFFALTKTFILSLGLLSAQPTMGLFQNDSLTYPGYILFSNNKTTYLIDNCGLIVNTWSSNYPPGVSVYLLENGNLLRTVELEGSFNAGGSGGGFELYNWRGDLLWTYNIAKENLHAHHDIEPMPNGNFLLTAWERHKENDAQSLGRLYDGEVWSERIIELEILPNNQARVVWQWRVWDHLIQDQHPDLNNYGGISENPQLIDLNYIGEGENTQGNWIHINAIDYNSNLDQLALSSRLFSEIWIIDHSTTSEQAAGHSGGRSGKGGDLLYRFGNPNAYQKGDVTTQFFRNQHDVQWIPDLYPNGGKLMVFNNNKNETQSAVEIWTPPIDANGSYFLNEKGVFGPENLDWTFVNEDFYSRLMSGAHLLPNGNIFICEGQTGRFFEITSEGEQVWEYINPVNSNGGPAIQGGTPRFNQTFRAIKYPHFYPAFEGRNMEGRLPVELNPIENECFVPVIEEEQAIEIKIIGNPVSDKLVIESNAENKVLRMEVFNGVGQWTQNQFIRFGINEFQVSAWSKGVYWIVFKEEDAYIDAHKVIVN